MFFSFYTMKMKKLLFTLTVTLCSLFFAPCSLNAQTIPPPYINYQAVLYDVNGANPNNPLINQSFTTFVNINDELGNLLYREEHYASTDANGLITVKMGDGLYTAGPITNFNQIDWGVGKYYLVVDFDINGTISSTAPEQLVTVPYSFYAGKAGNGMTSVIDNGDGTLTFTYANGATYTTPTLAGIQGPVGPVGATGPAGPSGASGTSGTDGQSAYDLWLAQGNTGTVQDFLSTSAYQIWLAQGNTGTAQDFINTLVGPSGPQGIQGIPGTNGANGATGPQGPAGANGTSGLNALIKTTTEPAGANCTNGGTKIETGLDANNNGILDVGEVNTGQTKYVCNGNNGSPGASAAQMNRVAFGSSGSWVCPNNVYQVTVELWGAGGGASATQTGGSGGYNRGTIAVIPGNSYSITVGVGGSASQNGGSSSFGGVLSAQGGGGGVQGQFGGTGSNGAVINWPYIGGTSYLPSQAGLASGSQSGCPSCPNYYNANSGYCIISY